VLVSAVDTPAKRVFRHDSIRDHREDDWSIAARVFDDAGAWTGRTAASTLTLCVVDHAKALVTATLPKPGTTEEAAAIAELRDQELLALFEKAWSVLLARPDGLALAIALHTRLAVPNNWPRVWRVEYPAIARRRARSSHTAEPVIRPPIISLNWPPNSNGK
jgi:hypothetical protein